MAVALGPVWMSGVGDDIGEVNYYSLSGDEENFQNFWIDTKPLTLSRRQSYAIQAKATATRVLRNCDFILEYRSFGSSKSLNGAVEPSFFNIGTLNYWDANFAPFTDMREPTWRGLIAYRASDRWQVSHYNLFISPKSRGGLREYYGLSFLKSSYELELGVTRQAFLQFPYYGRLYTLHDRVVVSSRDKSNLWGVGPALGFEKDFAVSRKLAATVGGSASILFGTYVTRNWFRDVESGYESLDTLQAYFSYDSRSDFFKWHPASFATARLKFSLNYNLWNEIDLGVGGWSEMFFDYPLVTRLHSPWDIGNSVAAPSGRKWKLDRHNVFNHGLSLSIGFAL